MEQARNQVCHFFPLCISVIRISVVFSALTLLVGRQEKHLARKKYGAMVEVGTGSPDGVAPSRMVSVSASVNLPLHHKVQKFSSGTGSPGWSRKKGHKTVVLVVFLSSGFQRNMTANFPEIWEWVQMGTGSIC